MSEQLPLADRRATESLLVQEIVRFKLTRDELAGKLYRLSLWRVFYVALGLGLVLSGVVALPIYMLASGESIGATLFLWAFISLMLFAPAQNVREAICEHIVGSWCAKRGLSTLDWIHGRGRLAPELPRRVKWAARYLQSERRL